jgi:O-antigen/teichoic acid export membrane protein
VTESGNTDPRKRRVPGASVTSPVTASSAGPIPVDGRLLQEGVSNLSTVDTSDKDRGADGPVEHSDLAPTRSEARIAARNSASLGGSLLFTSAVGVIVSLFVVPRVLSPNGVGVLASAEAVASIALVVAGFGMDSYLRKEIAVRRNHASDFFSGLFFFRLGVSVVFTAVALLVLRLRDADLGRETATSISIVVLFCVAQFFMQTSESFAAILQAVGEVKLQSRFSVLSKVAWASMVGVGLWLRVGLWVVPAALIMTELAKTLVFGVGAQRAVQISWRPTFRHLPPVLKASLPFLVTALSVKLIQFLDVAMIRLLTGSDLETAYYSTALKLSGVALLLAPIVQWVALPMAARAVERSRNEFANLVKRAYELVLCVGIPLSVLLTLNADLVLQKLLPKFAPGIPALRILSVLIVLSYISMLGGTLLIADGRGWRVVRIIFITIGLDFVLNLYMIRHGWQWFGPGNLGVKDGGAGTGAAISLATAELVGSSLYIYELRRVVRRVSDSASRQRVSLTVAACALTVAFDRLILGLQIGRPVLDVLVLFAFLRLFRVIEPTWVRLGWQMATNALRRKKKEP